MCAARYRSTWLSKKFGKSRQPTGDPRVGRRDSGRHRVKRWVDTPSSSCERRSNVGRKEEDSAVSIEKLAGSKGNPVDKFHREADGIIERFRDANIPRALEAAQKLKQAAQQIPKGNRAKELVEYFGKIRDTLIGGTIYAASYDDSQVPVRMGGPLDEEGRPLTEDKFPEGEFFMFDALGSLIESANELFPKRRVRRQALAESYFLIRELVAKKYADGDLDSYDAEAELDEAAYGLLPRKKGAVHDLAESWRRKIMYDIAIVKAGVRPDSTMSEEAERAAFDLHRKFNALSRGPDEPTKGHEGVFMAARDKEEEPTCYLNGRLLVLEDVTDDAGQPRVVLGSYFATAGEVLKVVRKKYPENDSPLTDAYRRKYEESLAALLPESPSDQD